MLFILTLACTTFPPFPPSTEAGPICQVASMSPADEGVSLPVVDAIPTDIWVGVEWDSGGLAEVTSEIIWIEDINVYAAGAILVLTEDNPEDGEDNSDYCSSSYIEVVGSAKVSVDWAVEPEYHAVTFRAHEGWQDYQDLLRFLEVDVTFDEKYQDDAVKHVGDPCSNYMIPYLSTGLEYRAPAEVGALTVDCDGTYRATPLASGHVSKISSR